MGKNQKKSLVEKFGDWFLNNQIGIYATTIVHLMIFLALTINTIHARLTTELIVVDFTHEKQKTDEEILRDEEQRLLAEKERLEQEVSEMLKENRANPVSIPNRIVNLGATSEKSSEGMGEEGSGLGVGGVRSDQSSRKAASQPIEPKRTLDLDRGTDDVSTGSNDGSKEGATPNKGPSIVSYNVDGRSAIYLPIPAYMCKEGGDVRVTIEVNRYGYVVNSSVDTKSSSKNSCLHDAAIAAAEKARFTSDPSGGNANGFILYRFLAQ